MVESGPGASRAVPGTVSTLAFWAFVAYLWAWSLDAVLRWALGSVGLGTLLYARDAVALGVPLLIVARAAHVGEPLPVTPLLLLTGLGAHAAVTMLFGADPWQTLIGIKLMLPMVFGATMVPLLLGRGPTLRRQLTLMLAVAIGGVLLSAVIDDLPWSQGVFESAFGSTETATERWTLSGVRRLSGFARASWDIAAVIALCMVTLTAGRASGWRSRAVALVCLGVIALTTAKAMFIAFAAWAVLLWVRDPLPRQRFAARGLAIACGIALMMPLAVLLFDAHRVVAPLDVPGGLASLWERFDDMWPRAMTLLTRPEAWVTGQGLGSISAGQVLAGEPAYRVNAADNIFVYAYVSAGVVGVAGLVLLAVVLSREPADGAPLAPWRSGVMLVGFIDGWTTNMFEIAWFCAFFGLVLGSLIEPVTRSVATTRRDGGRPRSTMRRQADVPEPAAPRERPLRVDGRGAGRLLRGVLLACACAGVLALAPRPADALEVGVGTHLGQGTGSVARVRAALASLGLEGVRDEIYWDHYEREPGRYGLEGVPPPMRELIDAPELARSMVILGYGNRHWAGGRRPVDAATRQAFARYAASVVDRIGDRVRYVELWNEWNIPIGTPEGVAGDPAAYVALVRTVAPVLRAKPRPFQLLIGAVGDDPADWSFVRTIIAGGLLPLADGLSVHLYNHSMGPLATPEEMFGRLERLQRLLRAGNGGRDYPVHVTEFGWPTGTERRAVPEAVSGAFIARFLLEATAFDWLRSAWVYELFDGGDDGGDIEHRFGLLDRAGRDKAGACAVREAIGLVRGMRVVDRAPAGDRVRWLKLEDGRDTVVALFAVRAEAPQTIALASDEVGRRARRMCAPGGAATTSVATSGRKLTVDTMPVLIRLPGIGLRIDQVLDRASRG